VDSFFQQKYIFMHYEQPIRPRRNRRTSAIRGLVRENTLHPNQLIYPLFLISGSNQRIAVESMPGISRLTLDFMLKEIEECLELGISSFAIFPVLPEHLKDSNATAGCKKHGLYPDAIRKIKEQFPQICLMSDVAMDPYSSDGHDGLVKDGEILNDPTLEILGKMALVHAEAGIDLIGPSDMMDGRVGYIRKKLDHHGYQGTGIISYTAKYASAFYGPFRDALDSAPKFGDKKTYQMDFGNAKEALIEADLDQKEGADILMVKPALSYLDVIQSLSNHSNLPIAAYNVSGEYAMVKAAANRGWVDGEAIMVEKLTSICRSGAQIILTYFAKEFADWYKNK
jgi:porphobilinogen synthase